MKEYCIFVICKGGCPYTVGSYPNIAAAKQALINMISDFDKRRKVFYIDNEFWENKYPMGLQNSIYYQIELMLILMIWKKFEEEKYHSNEKCKILKFHKKSIDF